MVLYVQRVGGSRIVKDIAQLAIRRKLGELFARLLGCSEKPGNARKRMIWEIV